MSSFEDCNNFIKRLEQTLELFGQYGDHGKVSRQCYMCTNRVSIVQLIEALFLDTTVIESFKEIAKNACEAELKCQAVELVVSNSRSYLNVEQIDKVSHILRC